MFEFMQKEIKDMTSLEQCLWLHGTHAARAEYASLTQEREELSEGKRIIELMKSDGAIRIIKNGRITRKLYWANDAQQWEVSSMESGRLTFPYKGGSLSVAIVALLDGGK